MIQVYTNFIHACHNCTVIFPVGIVDGRQGEPIKPIIPLTDLNLVIQLCQMLDAIVPKDVQDPAELEMYFVEAMYWSIGKIL